MGGLRRHYIIENKSGKESQLAQDLSPVWYIENVDIIEGRAG